MAIREVLKLGNPKLRKKSKEVEEIGHESREILEDLKDTLTHLQEKKNIGRALAAPQIGYFKKIIYIQTSQKNLFLINPKIKWKSDETYYVWDTCFSFDAAFFVKIKRNYKIKVKYKNQNSQVTIDEFEDDLSELIQHEVDHLFGKLATDHLEDNRNIIMREEWEKRYR